jgi:sugar lactone lactonase YvrE
MHSKKLLMSSFLPLVFLLTAPVQVLAQAIQYFPVITAFAGSTNGTAGYGGDGGPASNAALASPEGMAMDALGNIYIADTNNHLVRKVDATGVITTVVGSCSAAPCTSGSGGDGGAATSAQLNGPAAVALDGVGNLYIADANNNKIRVVNLSTGVINTYAGTGTAGTAGTGNPNGNGGAATAAKLNKPLGLAWYSGSLYIADTGDNQVRVVTGGTINNYAGTGAAGKTGDGGAATSATLQSPKVIAFDSLGRLYIADALNNKLRMVNTSNVISTFAGTGTASSGNTGDGGPALSAQFAGPRTVAVDSNNNVYISDGKYGVVRVINGTTQIINTIAGANSTTPGNLGDGLPGLDATLSTITSTNGNGPSGLLVDAAGNVYIADSGNNRIRKVGPNPHYRFPATDLGGTASVKNLFAQLLQSLTVQSFQIAPGFPNFSAGTVSGCTLGSSSVPGTVCTVPVTFAPTAPGRRKAPLILTDGNGTQYLAGVTGVGNAPAVGFVPATIGTAAGTTAGYSGDGGAASSAQFSGPYGAAVDDAGNGYIADTGNNVIRRVDSQTGDVTTVAGSGAMGYGGDGSLATSALLSSPTDVAVDPTGSLYIADSGNNVIRKVDASKGVISTYAGTGTAGYSGDGSAATNAQLSSPSSVAVDGSGNLYIADKGNNVVRKVNAQTGVITTLAGTGTAGYMGDGAAATSAELNGPAGIGVDDPANVYIADTGNNVIRRVDATAGTITTVAGNQSAGYSGDGGAAISASLNMPAAVKADAGDNLYIADTGNNVIRMVVGGNIITIAGNGTAGSSGDGLGAPSAELNNPQGMALDAAGKLYVADTNNNRIRRVDVSAPSLAFGQQNVGTTSASQTVIAYNFGNKPLNFSNLAVSGPFTQPAPGASDCVSTTTLNGGQSCTITVEFAPTVVGPFTGTVTLTNNALNQSGATQTVQLSGTSIVSIGGLTASGIGASVTAGSSQSVTVTAISEGGQTATDYVGTVHFTSTDTNAVLPADYTFTAADQGVHTFAITLVTAGTQSVTATDTTASQDTVTASTTVVAAAAATVTASAGTPQVAQVGAAYPVPFQVKVQDTYQNPAAGAQVTFAAPGSGASGVFAGNGASVTVNADVNGLATAPVFTANGTAGSFAVTATASGVNTSATFSLTNTSKAVPTLAIALNPNVSSVVYGQTVTLQATLSSGSGDVSTASGTVVFYDNGTQIGDAPVSSGGASLALSLPLAGAHSYTASYSGDVQFAGASSTAASLAVTPLQLTATATGVSFVYGQSVPSISGSISGVLAQDNGYVTAVFSTTATPASVVGTYPIAVQLSGTAAGNYTAQLASGAVATVTPASLTVTANNATRAYGAANPAFSGTFTGAVNNDQFTATYTTPAIASSPVNTYPITPVTVNGTHIADYTVSMVNGTLTVGQAGTATSLSSTGSSGSGANVTITATVISLTTGSPTGTVSFFDGGTLLGTGTLNAQGVTTYSTTTLSPGPHQVTGIYSGDSNFTGSTSSQLAVNVPVGDYTITTPAYLTVLRGQSATGQVMIAPTSGYQGAITLACSGVPALSSCTLAPATVNADGTNTPIQAILTFGATGSSQAQLYRFPGNGTGSLPATLYFLPNALVGFLLVPVSRKRKSGKKGLRLLLLGLVLMIAALGLASCGGGSGRNTATQIGAYTITVTATGAHGINHTSTVVVMIQ